MRTRTAVKLAISGIMLGSIATFDVSGALPGDIAASAGTPLVAAHSMTRALYSSYKGNLFQVRRSSDGKIKDIDVTGAGGLVNMDTLNKFCAGTACSVSVLYDQSGNANHLSQTNTVRQPSLWFWSTGNGTLVPMAVTRLRQYLRNRDKTSKIPVGAESQTEYFVVHGLHYNDSCCYDYGNMENPVGNDGPATMNALYFGSDTWYGSGAGTGPWGKVDFEEGVYAGGPRAYSGNPTTMQNLVMVLSKTNGTTSWVFKVGDPATGTLNTYWNGALPSGYSPLKQQGGLSLGEGGDGSNTGKGAFFEGVVIAAVTSDATDSLIQANNAGFYGTFKTGTFTPAADPSLQAWWDGNDKSTMTFSSGTVVQTWTDKSSHRYAATQGTASRQPTYFAGLLNGKGGLRFTRAKNNLLTSTGSDNAFTRGFLIMYVIQPMTMPASNISVLTQSTSTSYEPGLGFTNAGTNAPVAIAEFGASAKGGALKNTFLTPYIDAFISAAGAPAAGGAFIATPYVNSTAGSVLSQTVQAYSATGLHIGSDKFNDSYDGFIYEIVISSDTTAVTRLKYEEYFACKYGMIGFLPAGHPTTPLRSPLRQDGYHPESVVFSRPGLIVVNVPDDKIKVRVCNLQGKTVYVNRFTGLTPGRTVVIDLHKEIHSKGSSMVLVNVESKGKSIRAIVPWIAK